MNSINKILIILGLIALLAIGFKKIINYQDNSHTVIIETNKFQNQTNQELLKGNKITAEFKAKNNNLGIVSLLFNTHSRINDDYLQFRIKEIGSDQWYYSNKYKVDQFQNNKYFPFGFPQINDSKNKKYQIEIESLNGIEGNSVQLIMKNSPLLSKYSFPKAYLLQNKKEIPIFILNKIDSYFKHINSNEYLSIFGILIFLMLLLNFINFNKLLKTVKTLLSKINQRKPLPKTSSLNEIIPYLISSIAAISIFYIEDEKFLKKIQTVSPNTNMVLFILSILLFCSLFFICFLITKKITQKFAFKNYFLPKTISKLIIIVIFSLFLWIEWSIPINTSKITGYASINPLSREQTILILFLTSCLIFIFRKLLFKKILKSNIKIIWAILAILISGAVTWFLYTPNGLMYSYNYGAYYNSIYIHQQGIPYSENFTSIYGHYAILLRPLFNIIGINPYTISIVTTLIGFISVLCVVYVIYSFIKTPFIRLLGLGVLIFPFAILLVPYPQTYPHRFLFPSIIMMLGSYLIKHIKTKRKSILIIGYIISALSIIWNNDAGITCLITWGSLHTYILLSQNKFKKMDLLKLLIPIFSMIISFFCAWETVNIYNVAIGGKALSLYFFIFPLLETGYMYNILHLKIPLSLTYWIPILLLFYFFLSRGIASMSICTQKVKFNSKTALGFFVSIMGIGQMMYFINRCAHFNISLCYYQFILLILLTIEYTISAFLKNKKNLLDTTKTIIFYCSISTLITLILILCITVKPKIAFMKTYTNMNSLNAMTDYFKNTIDKDTPIVSISTASLGVALGWKNELGLIDLSDLFLDNSREYVINKLVDYGKPFLIEKGYYNFFGGIPGVFYLPACDNFQKIKNKYNIQELTEMDNIWKDNFGTSLDQSVFLYLTPKKTF